MNSAAMRIADVVTSQPEWTGSAIAGKMNWRDQWSVARFVCYARHDDIL